MKTTIFLTLLFTFSSLAHGQQLEEQKSKQIDQFFNAATGDYEAIQPDFNNKRIETNLSFSTVEADCSTDFFSINSIGEVQQWSLIDGEVVGGEILFLCPGNDLAYSNIGDSLTFSSGNYPETGIFYYDGIGEWEEISTDVTLLNNGGYEDNLYFLGLIGGWNRQIYHYTESDGLTLIESVTNNNFYSLADLAVDNKGQAWVIQNTDDFEFDSLKVFDKDGFITGFSIPALQSGTYGAFFLNDTLYLGRGFFNDIVPVIIENGSATIGASISFPNNNYYDFASCQGDGIVNSTAFNGVQRQPIIAYPNPTKGMINLSEETLNCLIYNAQGVLLEGFDKTRQIDITDYPVGQYFIKLQTKKGVFNQKIIKK